MNKVLIVIILILIMGIAFFATQANHQKVVEDKTKIVIVTTNEGKVIQNGEISKFEKFEGGTRFFMISGEVMETNLPFIVYTVNKEKLAPKATTPITPLPAPPATE